MLRGNLLERGLVEAHVIDDLGFIQCDCGHSRPGKDVIERGNRFFCSQECLGRFVLRLLSISLIKSWEVNNRFARFIIKPGQVVKVRGSVKVDELFVDSLVFTEGHQVKFTSKGRQVSLKDVLGLVSYEE